MGNFRTFEQGLRPPAVIDRANNRCDYFYGQFTVWAARLTCIVVCIILTLARLTAKGALGIDSSVLRAYSLEDTTE